MEFFPFPGTSIFSLKVFNCLDEAHLHDGGQSALLSLLIYMLTTGFPGGAVVENLPANAGDTGSSPGLGGSHMPRSG